MAYRLLKLNSLSGVPAGYPLSAADVLHATVGTGGSSWSGYSQSLSSVKLTFEQLSEWLGSASNTSAVWLSAGTGASTTVTLNAGGGANNAALFVGGGAVFNENSQDKDFRVESNGNTHALFVDAGNDTVGILNSSPSVALDVTGAVTASSHVTVGGNLNVAEYVYHTGDTDTNIRFTDDDVNITVGGVNMVDFTEGSDDNIVFNEAGADVDFRVETDDQTHALFIEGSSDRVGIAQASPATTLDVGGTITCDALACGDGNVTHVGDISLDTISSDGSTIGIGAGGDTVTCEGAWIFNEASNDVDFRIESNGDTHALFVDAGNNRVGILNSSPSVALDITGEGKTSSHFTVGDNLYLDEYVYHTGDTDTYMRWQADTIQVFAGAVEFIAFNEASQDECVINDGSADVDFRVESNGNANMIFVDGGNDWVGIGTGTPISPLMVNAGSTAHTCISSVGNIAAGGDVIAFTTSDNRLKDNVTNITFPLEKIEQMNGVEFTWNNLAAGKNGDEYGVIAQEVEKVLPLAVTERYDTKYKAVRYEQLIPVLVEGIKELTERVKKLESNV